MYHVSEKYSKNQQKSITLKRCNLIVQLIPFCTSAPDVCVWICSCSDDSGSRTAERKIHLTTLLPPFCLDTFFTLLENWKKNCFQIAESGMVNFIQKSDSQISQVKNIIQKFYPNFFSEMYMTGLVHKAESGRPNK